VALVALVALGWLWWRAWSPLVARDAAALCMAGVALGEIHLRFTWRGTWGHPSLFLRRRQGTSGSGLGLVACLVAVSRPWRRGTLRGRRGTWRHAHLTWQAWHWAGSGGELGPLGACDAAALCVAGVALADIHFRFPCHAWHFWHWAGSGGAVSRL